MINIATPEIGQVRTSVVSIWALTTVHHAYGAGLYQTPERLVEVGLGTVILVVTLLFLRNYEQTGSGRAYALFSALTLIWWVGASSIFHGGYGHVVKDALYFIFDVPVDALPRTREGTAPNDLFFEATGIANALFGVWVMVAWRRLAIRRRTVTTASHGQETAATA